MRLPRLRLPGIPQHVVIRGNNEQTIFQSDHDFRVCLDYLAEASVKYNCAVHAYVLMPNHIHLLATPEEAMGISRMIQLLARQYVQFYNKHNSRRGTLWEGRYKSALVDGEHYALDCYRYIELNPVRNGLTEKPSEYPWSSYHVNALCEQKTTHREKIDSIISPHASYMALGADTQQRRKSYTQLCTEALDPSLCSFIRRETNRSRVLGDEAFTAKIERLLNIDLSPRPKGGDHRSASYRISLEAANRSAEEFCA